MSAEIGLYAAAVAAAAATYFWRGFGVAVGGRLDPGGLLFEWFAAVAYAILAALVVRLVVFPSGELREIALAVRLGACAAALGTYLLFGRSLFAGCFAAAAVIAAVAGGMLG
jgi:branched-subunit amino acid transport protein